MKFDKTAFKIQTFKQASNHHEEYAKMSDEEKTEAWKYLMSVAFGFVGKPWPKMDKTYFHIRIRK